MPNDELDMYELTLEEEDHIQEVDTVLLLSLVPLHTQNRARNSQARYDVSCEFIKKIYGIQRFTRFESRSY